MRAGSFTKGSKFDVLYFLPTISPPAGPRKDLGNLTDAPRSNGPQRAQRAQQAFTYQRRTKNIPHTENEIERDGAITRPPCLASHPKTKTIAAARKRGAFCVMAFTFSRRRTSGPVNAISATDFRKVMPDVPTPWCDDTHAHAHTHTHTCTRTRTRTRTQSHTHTISHTHTHTHAHT